MMSRPVSLTKIIYDPCRTPNSKDSSVSSSVEDEYETHNTPIIMDEFGQTPDHFYLARRPPTFFQVKRKLDLQASNSGETNLKPGRRRRKLDGTANPKATPISKPRYDTSLGHLTKKFLKLLTDAADGVINLNTACSLLSVPKRRLYDITNVLEGAGLIQKTSRNNVQYKGRVSSENCVVACDLEKEIDILEAKENKLDELIYNMKSEINSIKESEGKYLYVTSDEMKNIEEFSKKTLLGVRIASTGQVIESSERKVVMTSKSSEMEAFLLAEDVSFINILNPKIAESKENPFKVQICNNRLTNFIEEEPFVEVGYGFERETTFPEIFKEVQWNEVLINESTSSQISSGATTWTEGDMVIKNAFIAEEDDIAPMGRNFLLQTEDQDLEDLPFSNSESHVDSYSFSLDDGEGLTDLFDCQFPSCS